jgi:hypothetical protein
MKVDEVAARTMRLAPGGEITEVRENLRVGHDRLVERVRRHSEREQA